MFYAKIAERRERLNNNRTATPMVLPDEALSENLLGLSFLSRLKRFEYANGAMVQEQ